MDDVSATTLKIRRQGASCFVQLHRPEANNTINSTMLEELRAAFTAASRSDVKVVVLEGLPEVFCPGADFAVIGRAALEGRATAADPEPLFDLLHQMAFGEVMTVAHVRGKVNAGGVGLVAACDVVIADDTATFSLSELLFGLIPAVVLPFLIRRVGFQRAHYLAATTQTVPVERACAWGLVDATQSDSQALVRRHLLRLGRLSRKAIARYKSYLGALAPIPASVKQAALHTNRAVFSDPENVAAIRRYTEQGLFPWERSAPAGTP
jgi:enoyl-CoA hydratase/carnithine racemase